MTIQQTLKIVDGRLMPSSEVLDATLIEVSGIENNALQIKEDGLFVSPSGGSGSSELPDGQEYITSTTGKVQRESVGVDSKHIVNLHTQVGLTSNLTTPSGAITYDGTSNLGAVGVPETNAGTISAYIRTGDSFVFTIPQGTSGRLGIGISGTMAYAEGYYSSYPFILKDVSLSELTEETTITISMSTSLIVTVDAQNSAGSVEGVSGTYTATQFQAVLDSAGIPSISVTLILTNTNSVSVNLGDTYPLEETINTPFLAFREDIKMITDTEGNLVNLSLAYGLKAKATKSECTSIGNSAESTSAHSTALGFNAKASGFESNSFGHGSVSSGNSSISVGTRAQSTGTFGASFGFNAKSLGSSSTSLGCNSEASVSSTTAVGSSSKAQGLNSTAIGAVSTVYSGYTGGVAIGFESSTGGSQQIQLGGSSTTTYAYGAVQDRSDIRDKSDIQDITLGLDFINLLRPVKYKWDYREDYFNELHPFINRSDFETEDSYQEALEKRQSDKELFFSNPVKDGSKIRSRYHHGLIAQELKSTLDSLGEDHAAFQDHSIRGGLDVKSIGYAELIPNLIKAIQELSVQNKELKSRLDSLQ